MQQLRKTNDRNAQTQRQHTKSAACRKNRFLHCGNPTQRLIADPSFPNFVPGKVGCHDVSLGFGGLATLGKGVQLVSLKLLVTSCALYRFTSILQHKNHLT